eukprot:GDKI01045466.1.p1 GENE.GDKI01045466.1~~GDKI01045466.1.p1  ORF type:complete len:260 (-),score=27.44 GDKI01045466.1:65-751(-)
MKERFKNSGVLCWVCEILDVYVGDNQALLVGVDLQSGSDFEHATTRLLIDQAAETEQSLIDDGRSPEIVRDFFAKLKSEAELVLDVWNYDASECLHVRNTSFPTQMFTSSTEPKIQTVSDWPVHVTNVYEGDNDEMYVVAASIPIFDTPVLPDLPTVGSDSSQTESSPVTVLQRRLQTGNPPEYIGYLRIDIQMLPNPALDAYVKEKQHLWNRMVLLREMAEKLTVRN